MQKERKINLIFQGEKRAEKKKKRITQFFLERMFDKKSNIHTKQKSIKKIGILMKENFMIYTKG